MDHSARERLASPALLLEEKMSADQVQQLLTLFRLRQPPARGRMTTHDFRGSLARLLGRDEADEAVAQLSAKIDSEIQGYISEEDVCTHVLQYLQEKDTLTQIRSLPLQDPPSFKQCPHSKAPLCRLMPASNPNRWITVSKDGAVSSWSPNLQLQGGKRMEAGGRSGVHVTDCAVMDNCNKLVVATTSRELMFFDLTTPAYKCQYKVHDLPCMPLCLSYSYDPQSSSHLLYGDESGVVTLLTFHSPHLGLFNHPPGQGRRDNMPALLIAFNHLTTDHRDCLSVQLVPGCHGDWVRRVQYSSHNQSVLSCAGSSSHSILLRDVGRKRKMYNFRIRKGVICFDYSHSLELLVSGGVDHLVRLWNPYVPSKPIALLSGHSTAVMDVLIHKEAALVFSLSQDLVLCAWDIRGHELVQSVSLKFPFTQRLPDFGPACLHVLQSDCLVVLCIEYLAELKLTVHGANRSTTTSHTHPITAVLYNAHSCHVVSGCEGGVVNVWDVRNGRHILRLTDCHEAQEITAMAFDGTGKRLITASQAGEVKVWHYMNRTCLKWMTVPGECEVTGLLHFLDKSRFLAVSWNRRITTFPDEPDVFHVNPDEYWQGEDHHKDDILCVDYCPPHYLATGSFDGEIIVWNMDTEKIISKFHSMTRVRPKLLKGLREASFVSRTPGLSRSSVSTPSRPSSRRLSSYRMKANSMDLQRVPVDQILFLKTRVKARVKDVATLVSSEGGNASFLDIYGKREPIDETVMALTVDHEDQTLLTGDTAGFIAIFDITNFCHTPAHDDTIPDPLVRWRAHAGEVLSMKYALLDGLQPVILSVSGDCTAKLWTMQGQCIGTFGQLVGCVCHVTHRCLVYHTQEPVWNITDPSTFQQWSQFDEKPDTLEHSPPPSDGDTILPAVVAVEEQENELVDDEDGLYPTSSSGHLGTPVIFSKSLGQPYVQSAQRRMVDRAERRVQFSEISVESTERFGLLCTPYQALQLLEVDEITNFRPNT